MTGSSPSCFAVPRDNLIGLQVLRFVAAFMVFFCHIGHSLHLEAGYQDNPFAFGLSGVDIFFVISGFIIAYSTDGTKGAWYFALRRIARIVPLYWFLTLGVVAVALIFPGLLNSTTVSGDTLLKSLLFVPFEKAPGTVHPILYVGWTLNYEMFFYALYAACIAIGLRTPLAPALLIVALITIGQITTIDSVAWRFYTAPQMLEFVFGIVLYLAYWRWPSLFRGHALTTLALCAAVAIALSFVNFPEIVTVGLPAILLVASAVSWSRRNGPTVNALAYLGGASYALYLSHPFVVQAFVKVVPVHGAKEVALVGMITAALAIILSVALYRLIERPAQNFILNAIHRQPATPREGHRQTSRFSSERPQ